LDIQDNIKLSFQKARESISQLNLRISALEEEMGSIKSVLDQILHMQTIPTPELPNLKTAENPKFGGLEPQNPKIQESSIGNEGVPLRQTFDKLSTNFRQTDRQQTDQIPPLEELQELKRELETRFLSLTEAQFKVFMAIYHLEEQSGSPVCYSDISKYLLISQSAVRDYISDLILRNIPLTKHKSPNRKIYLSIKKEFKNLKILENLLSLREKDASQAQIVSNLRQYF